MAKSIKVKHTNFEETFGSAINKSSIVVHFSKEGKILYFNEQFSLLMDQNENELIGCDIRKIFLNSNTKYKLEEICLACEKGEIWSGEIYHKNSKSGLETWMLTKIVPHVDTLTFVVFGWNISQQKKADNQLSDYSTKLAMALEIGNIGMWEMNFDEASVVLHEKFANTLNIDEKNISLKDFVQMIHPLDQKFFIQQLDEFKQGKCQKIEVVSRFKKQGHDGDLWVHFLQKALPIIFDEEGRAKVLMGTCLDISEMEMNRLILEEQREQIESAYAQKRSLIGLLKISNKILPVREKLASSLAYLAEVRDWSETPNIGLYVFKNEQYELLASYPEIAEKKAVWGKSFSKDQSATVPSNLMLPLKSGESPIGFLFFKEKSLDSLVDFELFAGISEGMAQVLSKTIIEMELEDEKARMIYSSKMTTLGEMSGSIAHEINNPLAIILGTTSVMRSMIKKGTLTQDKIDKDIDRITKTAERMANIIKGLKSFSRNADNDPIVLVELKNILEDTLSLCQEKLKIRGVELFLPDNSTFKIPCRATHICQVLLNLISNATDAIENVSPKWVRIECEENEREYLLRVTDSGPGIPKEVLEKIMTPFFTTKSEGKGTGLGLSISLKIMKSHGGTLSYNQESPNTQFVLTLPKQILQQQIEKKSA